MSSGSQTELPDRSLQEQTQWLLRLEDAELQAVMNRLAPEDAARALRAATGVEDRTRLIWAMEKPQRARVMDHLPAPFLAGLIQNSEARNRRLLSDISYQAFRDLLELCSPEQRYYWLSLANSYDDLPSSLLTLLIPVPALAEILMTNPEYRGSLPRLAALEAEGLRVTVPIADPRLRRILETVIDVDPERYPELIQESFRLADYRLHHPDERELLSQPLILPEAPREAAPAVRAPEPPQGSEPLEEPPTELALPFLRALQRLVPERRSELLAELERLLQQEIVGLGGSFAQESLDRASARLRCAVQMALLRRRAYTEEEVLSLLNRTRPSELLLEGHQWIEEIRQRAIRLLAFRHQLEPEEINLLNSLLQPNYSCHPQTESPVFILKPKRKGEKKAPEPEMVPVLQIERRLADLAAKVTRI